MTAWYLAIYWYKTRHDTIFGKSNNELVIGIHVAAGELFRVLLARVFHSSWYMIQPRRSRIF